jgi:preprotein translocase subunit SecY
MLKEEGEDGQRKMNQWTFYATVPLSLLYAFGQARLFAAGSASILPSFGFGEGQILPTITILITMMAGTMFCRLAG